ncbi:MBL fold metallo-hydrolase [Candidatus Thorarchaeota archaeon]|nr:MAG: MBL fold metallo-hydrolase [Candidatus Thorarchaeota archaeon]
MKITMLGTGTSYPDPERVQSGILIELENDRILFDIGAGTYFRMNQLEIDLKTISSIFITHFHIDHCSDFLMLCQSLWLSGDDRQLDVYGPPFIIPWFRGIFDITYTYARDRLSLSSSVLYENVAIQVGDALISNVPTIHGTMDTRALKLEAEGKVFVYSSDTAPCKDVINLAKGADVLVHECNWLDGPHPEGVHTTPSQLTDILEEVQPRKVILTHVSPEVVKNSNKVVDIVNRRTDAEVFFGQDLLSVTL